MDPATPHPSQLSPEDATQIEAALAVIDKTLSERQRAVLDGKLLGKPDPVVAAEIDVSRQTVHHEKAAMMGVIRAAALGFNEELQDAD